MRTLVVAALIAWPFASVAFGLLLGPVLRRNAERYPLVGTEVRP